MRSSVRWLNDILIKNIYMGIEWREELILICYERMINRREKWGSRIIEIEDNDMTELYMINNWYEFMMNLR